MLDHVRTLYRNARFTPPPPATRRRCWSTGATITWIGTTKRPGLAGLAERTVDLDGAFVTPAFVDAHMHATRPGLSLTGLDLSPAESLADALGRVERPRRAGRGRPVLGQRLGRDALARAARCRRLAELDRAGIRRAVYLSRVDAHSAVVSSALLAAASGVGALPGYRSDGWLTTAAHDAARLVALRTASPPRRSATPSGRHPGPCGDARHRLRARDGRPGDLERRRPVSAARAG